MCELKEGKTHEIVTPVPEESLVECCSSFTMNESVLESERRNGSLLKAEKP